MSTEPSGSHDSGLGLDRPRLVSLLDQATKHRLTTIIAGPGSGKTTLLSQWVSVRPAAWHTVTASEVTVAAFARNVIDKLRLHAPDLSPQLMMVLEGPQGPDVAGGSASRSDFLAAEICRELEKRLKRDIVLVVDDVHLLDRSGESARFLGALCRQAPPRFHLVVASREQLPFPVARLRVDGHVTELSGEQLAFTADETARLVRLMGDDADPDWITRLQGRTGGWAVAVAFAARARGLEPGREARDDLAADAPLFEYLAEEVIAAELPADLAAMRRAAELPWVTAELLTFVEPDGRTPALFESEWLNTYATASSGHPNAVALTPLVRDFLRERHPLSADTRQATLRHAAAWYEARGALGEAMWCLAEAGANAALIELLSERGDTILASGLARQVVSVMEGLAGEDLPSQVLLLEAESLQTLGDWESAMACYQRLIPAWDDMPPALAWRLGFLHHMRGDVDAALEVYRRGRVDQGDEANAAALLAWTASAHWLRGERDEAGRLAEEALSLARSVDDSRSLATAHTVLAMVSALDGDRAANDAHYLRALEHAERARDVLQTIRIRSNRASHFLEEGSYEEAMAELNIALRLADLSGFELWRGMALSNRAEVLFHRGRLDESLAGLEESRSIFRRLGSSLEAYPLAHMGDVYLARGDTALARASYQAAVDLSEKPSDLQALVPALSGLARVVADDQPEEAARLARAAAEVDSVLGHVKALLANAWVARANGDVTTALEFARQAATVARSRRDMAGLGEALEIEASVTEDRPRSRQLLEQARNVWEEIGEPLGTARVDVALGSLLGDEEDSYLVESAAASLQRMGAKTAAAQARRLAQSMLRPDGPDVEIKTLGGFSITRGGQPVPTSAWQSKVAREVLWMLLANRGRPIHREILIDRLWPDDDPAKAANRLSVALTTIRNVLDPERQAESDAYIRTDRETTALVLDQVRVDIEMFLAETNRGFGLLRGGDKPRGLAVLRSAEERYVGEFLEEQPYADWAISLREEARTAYLAVAEELARADMEEHDHDSAARRYLRMLERDVYNEPAHLGLVEAMLAAGRHGAARRLYGIYASRMEELEVEPASFPSGSGTPPDSS